MNLKTDNEEIKKTEMISILNHSIDKLNSLNKTNDQLSRFSPTQEIIFCDIYNSCYNMLKNKSSNIVNYNSNNNIYIINLTFYLNQFQDSSSKVSDFVLTENEFIKLIIDSILFAMFKYNGKSVLTRDSYDNNVLVSNSALKKHYHNLMNKLTLYLFESYELSNKLQQLADDFSKIPGEKMNLFYIPTLLPRPKTPDQGWPSSSKWGSKKVEK